MAIFAECLMSLSQNSESSCLLLGLTAFAPNDRPVHTRSCHVLAVKLKSRPNQQRVDIRAGTSKIDSFDTEVTNV